MESLDSKEEKKKPDERFRQEIYSKVIRAGKRTYFFDVKSTRNNEYYLTITESKKKFSENGKFHYEKHKIFLYQEDFEKFTECLEDVVRFIHEKQPETEKPVPIAEEKPEEIPVTSNGEGKDFTDVDFEDI
ncbi:MAG: DUF3276 family protein [Tangfeifania sp.]